jgi:hypothetical protein
VIQRNRNPAGRLWNITFGLAQLLDGLVRVLSLGQLHTTATLDVARQQALAHFRRLRRSRQ